MENQSRKKITWTIKNSFSLLRSEKLYSDTFVVGRCKWRLCAYPNGNNVDLFLEVAEYESLPLGWRRQARYLLNIVNQYSVKRSKQNEIEEWFDKESPRWGCLSMFPMNEIQARDSGFLVNGELKVVAEVELLQVIGKLDVSEETSTITETIDVKGFQLLPSEVKFVSHMFEKHPEITTPVGTRNPTLLAGYLNLLLSLIETLRQSPYELPMIELSEADGVLGALMEAGFKLDWLEKRLNEMLESKRKEEAAVKRMKQIEEELKGLKQKFSDLEAKLEKEKEEVSALKRRHITFDDVI